MYWVILIVALIGLDQLTKWFILVNKVQFENLPVIKNFFYITYLENRGAAFGILQNFRWGFIILTVIAMVGIFWFFLKNKHIVLRLALSFLIAGALGNFIDRLLRGFVVDFFHFFPFGYDFAVFNVADICVNVSVALLIIYLLFIYKDPAKAKKETAEVKDEQPGD